MVTYSYSLSQIKLSSVQLARKYMKRASIELDAMGGPEKEPNREFLHLQGVRLLSVFIRCKVTRKIDENCSVTTLLGFANKR
ncbi:hypothetical protein Ddye_030858 [Dipteronia dyeriana]|uniref:Uncharacterized protein n=1 Tax=Dipteronia dyeriana TaxID=168575 RepID=A0AAD9THV4_9ROSI|nr:hypothetical protein Ddye_030858 [Dipteronia dyeriana]